LFPASIIDTDTVNAYRETQYHVHSDAPFALRLGHAEPALAALHKAARVNRSAFITACNPLSEPMDETVNADRQAKLAKELTACNVQFIAGIGRHPSNDWPGEPSFLVLGLSLEAARAVGAKFEQNAIVWCGADAVPQLILLR